MGVRFLPFMKSTGGVQFAGSGTLDTSGGGGSGSGSAFEYSRTEQRIGTWVDGSPIYRIVFDENVTLSQTWVTLSTKISGMSRILDGSVLNSEGIFPIFMITQGENILVQSWRADPLSVTTFIITYIKEV